MITYIIFINTKKYLHQISYICIAPPFFPIQHNVTYLINLEKIVTSVWSFYSCHFKKQKASIFCLKMQCTSEMIYKNNSVEFVMKPSFFTFSSLFTYILIYWQWNDNKKIQHIPATNTKNKYQQQILLLHWSYWLKCTKCIKIKGLRNSISQSYSADTFRTNLKRTFPFVLKFIFLKQYGAGLPNCC